MCRVVGFNESFQEDNKKMQSHLKKVSKLKKKKVETYLILYGDDGQFRWVVNFILRLFDDVALFFFCILTTGAHILRKEPSLPVLAHDLSKKHTKVFIFLL